MNNPRQNMSNAAAVVRDAGGEIVGRTRLQKVAYLLELVGLGSGYRFDYRYYGPYCEELAEGIRDAWSFDLVEEEEYPASWGGTYSIYRSTPDAGDRDTGPRAQIAQAAAGVDAIVLELAATAAFLKEEEGSEDPWGETQRRKPGKASEKRIKAAQDVIRNLKALQASFGTPKELPDI